MKAALSSALCAALLAGCASPGVERYRDERPALDLRDYFNGTVDGWGMFQSRSGEIKKRFTVRIDAHWEGATGVLDEHFEWSDGSKSRRVWTLTDKGGGRYSGRADDVVGSASGEGGGPAVNWRYTMALPVDGRVYHVAFDDWLVLIDEQVLLNRAAMSKFGFRLGEVTLAFRRR
jgi:hypothetical protein